MGAGIAVGLGRAVLRAVAKAGKWAAKNPGTVLGAVDQVKSRIAVAKAQKQAADTEQEQKEAALSEALAALQLRMDTELGQLRLQLAEAEGKQAALETKLSSLRKKLILVTALAALSLAATVVIACLL